MNVSKLQRGSQLWHRRHSRSFRLFLFNLEGIHHYSSGTYSRHEDQKAIQRTRNIGIIAHIDAGKTTTTERMLYYSGYTRCIGDVDDGSTVTDFLPSERARGITIQSAAVTFRWPPVNECSSSKSHLQKSLVSHTINLIDTPGHVDFTFEVLRSLRVLDGAICILDGVAGVEAQTEKVWAQAQEYSIPRIVFVNKLDRDGASFETTIREIPIRLHGLPALCQIPWWEGGKGRFCGVGDAINLCALKWQPGTDGKNIQVFTLQQLNESDPHFYAELVKARHALVENICDFDEQLLEAWLAANDDTLSLTAKQIRESLRRTVINGTGKLIPVFAGASFRNIGVQPLLDAVIDLFPDPSERPDPDLTINSPENGSLDLKRMVPSLGIPTKKNLPRNSRSINSLVSNLEACALAFKVVNDARRGVLVYIRVYFGTVKRNAQIWNTNLQVSEKAQRILQMQASDAIELPQIGTGQIGAIIGPKFARTGDTLISYPNVNPKSGPPQPINSLHLRPIDIPPPVFFASIEPHSLGEEKNVADMLALLLREDPSLQMKVDEDSGQMLLSGMGELHLEIARDRLVNDFKAQATMGQVEISYRECVINPTSEKRYTFDREIAGKKAKASCRTRIEPIDEKFTIEESTTTNDTIACEGNLITIQISPGTESLDVENILPRGLEISDIRTALFHGASAALARGPRRLFPLHNTHVIIKLNLKSDLYGIDTSSASLSSAARLAVKSNLEESFSKNEIAIMEPVMKVLISCDEAHLGALVHDISSARGGQVNSLGSDGHDDAMMSPLTTVAPKIYAPKDPFSCSTSETVEHKTIQRRQINAKVPLKEMVGYLKHLRSLTAGRGTFTMSVDRFEKLTGPRERCI